MKLTKLLKKTLLATAMLCVGVNGAWAQTYTTNTASCNFENSETLFTTAGRVTGSNVLETGSETNHVYSFVSAGNAGNVAPGAFAYYDFSSIAQTAALVDISFDCYIPQAAGQVKVSFGDASLRTSSLFTNTGAWSYNNSGAIFAIGSERGKLNGKTNENYASISGTSYGSTTGIKADALLGLWISVSANVNIANKTVSYTVKNRATNAAIVSVTDAAFYSDAANACTQLDIQTGINSTTVYVDNVSVTAYIDASEKFADYTIKYMYGETEIKTARTVENIKVGNDATILDSDKANIWYNSEKYIYVSDDAAGKTVAEDGSTVVTVTFRKATTAAYSVNLINSADESVLFENYATGTIIEGEPSTVYYHKAFKLNNVWYVRAQNSGEPYYGINVVAGVNTVAYTANSEISYFFEVEDLPVVKLGSYDGWRNDGMASRSSGGQAPRHYGKNYAYTGELAGGIYTLTMNARNQSSSVSDNVILAIMDANGTITTLDNQFDEWPKAQTAEHTVSVSIPDGAKFVLKCGDNNSNLNMDFLMFTRIDDFTISVPVSNGYATYANHDYALDFSNVEGLKAYTATVKDASTVTFTPATQVPAGTGLLLKGETRDVPVIVSAAAINSNVLYAPMTEVSDLDYDDGTNYNYILTAVNSKVGFYKANNNTVAVGKAYIRIPKGSLARELTFIGFDDDNTTTGINNVNIDLNDDWYDLQGRRVNQPSKGLYIMNGKKVIIK